MSMRGSFANAVDGLWTLVRKHRGLIAVLALFVSFGMLNVFGVPDLKPYDERAHLGYSLALADGVLPSIESKLPTSVFGRASGVRAHVWVANHPPLFYAIAAPFTSHGLSSAGLAGAVTYGRWVSLLLASVGLIYVHAAARLLSRGDERFALFATVVSASFPSLIQIGSLVHNDGLAFLVAAGGLHSALALALRGYSIGRVASLTVWACLAMLTRFTSLAVLGAMGLIACGGLLFAFESPLRQRLIRSLSTGAILVASVAVTSGWFYVRNVRLYGDITGGAVLFRKFGRSPRGSVLKHVLDVDRWEEIYRDLWTRFGGGVRVEGFISDVAWCLLLAACVGLGMRAFRTIGQSKTKWLSARTLCIAGLTAAVLASIAAMFVFYSRGGKLHARYLLPVLWIFASLMAWGLSAFGNKVMGFVTIFLGLFNLVIFNAVLGGFVQDRDGDPVMFVQLLRDSGVSGAPWIVGAALVTMAICLYVIVNAYSATEGVPSDVDARRTSRRDTVSRSRAFVHRTTETQVTHPAG